MKKIILYIIVLTAALVIPKRGTDVGKLLPVEVVSLRTENDRIVIETDTEDVGMGETIEQALQNLKDTTAGTVFLDTADYLLVTEQTAAKIKEMSRYLKDSVRVCCQEEPVDLIEAAAYLAVHKPEATIKTCLETGEMQMLKTENKRMILEQNIGQSSNLVTG